MKELLQKRAQIFEQARNLILKAEGEGRSLTSDEQTEHDKRMADVKALGETIERSKVSADMDAEFSKSILDGKPVQARSGSDIADTGLDSFIRGGVNELNTEQRSMFGVKGKADIVTFNTRVASPLSDVTGAAGAFTVPQGFVNQLEIAMKWYGGVRNSNAKVIKTASGQDLPWPTMNDTGNVGELISENTPVTQASTEMSFDHVVFKAYKYSSKLVLVPYELINDSAFDVQAFVANALGTRIGRIQNQNFTTGGGSTLPKGVVTAATLGVTAANAQTADILYSDLVSLVHSVDAAYRPGSQWMFHDSTAAYLEQLKDKNDRPIINSSLTGISNTVNAGNVAGGSTLLGYPVVINNDMATLGASHKTMLFGDFSKYVVRDVQDIMLVRFGETYMASGQIGFLCYARADGNLVDAGAGPIRYFINAA